MKEHLCVQSLARTRVPLDISNGMRVYTQVTVSELFSSPIASMIEESEQSELHIPFTGFGYSLEEDSWLFDLARTFNVFRLDEISQLEYLEDPRETPLQLGTSVRFSHTRYRHSSNVAALALAIAEVNKTWFVKNPGFREALLVAALTHDTLTPAGGDTTKAIDREGFDEDMQYHTLMTQERREFLSQHNVDPSLCVATVRGEGVLGSMLDIADKLAYTGHDFEKFAGLPLFGGITTMRRRGLSQHLRKNILFCSVWENVRVADDMVWFEDAKRLTHFLTIRALLFRQLYTHPKARYRDALLMYQTLLFLYEEKHLSKEAFLRMDDGSLRIFLQDRVGWRPDKMLPSCGHFRPKHRGFTNLADAEEFGESLTKQGRLFVRVEDLRKVFKPATHFNVRVQGKIRPLKDAQPAYAERIAQAGATIDPIRVSYLEGTEPHLGPLTDAFRVWCAKKNTR